MISEFFAGNDFSNEKMIDKTNKFGYLLMVFLGLPVVRVNQCRGKSFRLLVRNIFRRTNLWKVQSMSDRKWFIMVLSLLSVLSQLNFVQMLGFS